jgi:hypothetical protein
MTSLRIALAALVVASAVLGAPAAAQNGADSQLRLDLSRQLLEVSGTMRMSGQMLDQMTRLQVEAFRRANPGRGEAAARFVEDHLAPALRARMGELEDVFVHLWAGNFDAPELEEIIAFYRSPLGRKLIERSPRLMQQGMAAGAAWGERVEREALEQLRSEMSRRNLRPPI